MTSKRIQFREVMPGWRQAVRLRNERSQTEESNRSKWDQTKKSPIESNEKPNKAK